MFVMNCLEIKIKERVFITKINFFLANVSRYCTRVIVSVAGITQELIDETRLLREKQMLRDLEILAESGASLEFHGRGGETPVNKLHRDDILNTCD